MILPRTDRVGGVADRLTRVARVFDILDLAKELQSGDVAPRWGASPSWRGGRSRGMTDTGISGRSAGHMIRSFRCKETERLFNRSPSRRWRNIERIVRRKLELLNAAISLRDLTVPPNNRLEALKGNRRGQHSIRVNDQWRVCFVWRDGDAHEVEVVDYH